MLNEIINNGGAITKILLLYMPITQYNILYYRYIKQLILFLGVKSKYVNWYK